MLTRRVVYSELRAREGDRITSNGVGEGQANSCVSVERIAGKVTELRRVSPLVSGHKKTPQAVAEGSGRIRARNTWQRSDGVLGRRPRH